MKKKTPAKAPGRSAKAGATVRTAKRGAAAGVAKVPPADARARSEASQARRASGRTIAPHIRSESDAVKASKYEPQHKVGTHTE